MAKKRRRKGRPLLIASAGLAAITYYGCSEPVAIGNPKRPPDMGISEDGGKDMSVDMSVVGNPKQPPDMTPINDGSSGD